MERGKQILLSAILLALIVAFSALTAAEGSTTYQRVNKTQDSANSVNADSIRLCSNHTILKDRLRCRLQNHEDGPSVPEACRNLALTNKDRCRAFYDNVRPCYTLSGREKDSCFRRIAGLGTASVSGNADKTPLRNYLVALLYDLEEKVEVKYDSGEITAEESSELIEMITNIKEQILSESANRTEIKADLAELRQKWSEVMQ